MLHHKDLIIKTFGYLANAEVYDAEVVAAAKAMEAASKKVRDNNTIQEGLLFLDNSAAVDGLLETP